MKSDIKKREIYEIPGRINAGTGRGKLYQFGHNKKWYVSLRDFEDITGVEMFRYDVTSRIPYEEILRDDLIVRYKETVFHQGGGALVMVDINSLERSMNSDDKRRIDIVKNMCATFAGK